MSNHILTCQQIVQRCGGPVELSKQVGRTHWAVYKWNKNGIPDEYWDLIMSLAGVSVDQIYNANLRARGAEGSIREHEGAAA
jgi:hypothetical protein